MLFKSSKYYFFSALLSLNQLSAYRYLSVFWYCYDIYSRKPVVEWDGAYNQWPEEYGRGPDSDFKKQLRDSIGTKNL